MILSGIPPHLLARAAALPENQHARTALQRAAGLAGDTEVHQEGEGAQKRSEGAGDVLTVVLPLPDKALSPNARVHWAKKARAVREYRELASNEAFCACIEAAIYTPQWTTAEVQAVFYFSQRRTRDADNLLASLKPALDGLADAGVVANDSGLTHHPVRVEIDRQRPRVELVIRPS